MPEDDAWPKTPAGGVNVLVLHDERIRAIELKLAEHLGRCGDGGTFAIMETTMRRLQADLEVLGEFRTKVLTYVSIGIPVAGFLAAIASHGIQKLLGW